MTHPLVRKLQVRDRLDEAEVAVLEGLEHEVRRVAAHEDLVREGDQAEHSILLLDGWAARYKVTAEGKRQITAVHITGDFVDLHSLLLKPMDHSVATLSECTIATVPHPVLRAITEQHPHLTRLLWLNTLIDAANHRQWLLMLGRLPARAQLAHFLCEMYVRLAAVGLATDFRLKVPMTQATLGDTLALSTVHVNRIIQEFRQSGLVTWTNDDVAIQDWDRLVELGEFDPAYLNLVRFPR